MTNVLGYLCSSHIIYELISEETKIGRAKSCDIVMDMSRSISAEHAIIYCYANKTSFIHDLNSKNGTFINDLMIPKQKVKINDGDIIRFAFDKQSFIFHFPPLDDVYKFSHPDYSDLPKKNTKDLPPAGLPSLINQNYERNIDKNLYRNYEQSPSKNRDHYNKSQISPRKSPINASNVENDLDKTQPVSKKKKVKVQYPPPVSYEIPKDGSGISPSRELTKFRNFLDKEKQLKSYEEEINLLKQQHNHENTELVQKIKDLEEMNTKLMQEIQDDKILLENNNSNRNLMNGNRSFDDSLNKQTDQVIPHDILKDSISGHDARTNSLINHESKTNDLINTHNIGVPPGTDVLADNADIIPPIIDEVIPPQNIDNILIINTDNNTNLSDHNLDISKLGKFLYQGDESLPPNMSINSNNPNLQTMNETRLESQNDAHSSIFPEHVDQFNNSSDIKSKSIDNNTVNDDIIAHPPFSIPFTDSIGASSIPNYTNPFHIWRTSSLPSSAATDQSIIQTTADLSSSLNSYPINNIIYFPNLDPYQNSRSGTIPQLSSLLGSKGINNLLIFDPNAQYQPNTQHLLSRPECPIPISQSISHSSPQSIFQSILPSISQSISQPISHSMSHSISQSISHSLSPSIPNSISDSISHSITIPTSYSLSISHSHSISKSLPLSQSLSTPISHQISLSHSSSASVISGPISLSQSITPQLPPQYLLSMPGDEAIPPSFPQPLDDSMNNNQRIPVNNLFGDESLPPEFPNQNIPLSITPNRRNIRPPIPTGDENMPPYLNIQNQLSYNRNKPLSDERIDGILPSDYILASSQNSIHSPSNLPNSRIFPNYSRKEYIDNFNHNSNSILPNDLKMSQKKETTPVIEEKEKITVSLKPLSKEFISSLLLKDGNFQSDFQNQSNDVIHDLIKQRNDITRLDRQLQFYGYVTKNSKPKPPINNSTNNHITNPRDATKLKTLLTRNPNK